MITKYYRNADGDYLGAFDVPPEGGLEVSEAPDHADQKWDGTRWLSPPNPTIIVYPVDLWARMTDDEADMVEAEMVKQPARVQNIFKYASSYRSDHELWPLLEGMATNLFGRTRAAEILAPF